MLGGLSVQTRQNPCFVMGFERKKDVRNLLEQVPDIFLSSFFLALRGRDDFKKLLTELETRNKAKAAKV